MRYQSFLIAFVFTLSLGGVRPAAAIVIDTEDGPPAAIGVGAWMASTSSSQYLGGNYQHDQNSDKGTKSWTFVPNIPTTKSYVVSAYWAADSNRASNAPFTINHANGSTVYIADQTTSGGWNELGLFTFNAGNSGNVVLSNTGTNGYVIADAVRFEVGYLDEIIVDNTDPEATLVGGWTSSTSQSGYVGSDYQHDGNTGQGTKTATYAPTFSESGLWEVFINYTADDNRADNVPVDINHLGGTTTVIVDQTTGGGSWQSLGLFDFAAGNSGSAVIRTTDANAYVIADAFRFSLVSITAAVPEPTTFAIAALLLLPPVGLGRRRRVR